MEQEQFDRALRGLEKRTHLPKTRSRVREEVANLLKAPDCDLPDHRNLLMLSRNRDGRPRLLTTNFDTLFERASPGDEEHGVQSHAGRALPKAGGESDFDILHLHGRIEDKRLKLGGTDLVLTSADFGDAYLRGRWASRYIEDRMRLDTLVLVGNDP